MISMFGALTYAYNNTTMPVCTSSVFGSLDSRVTQKFEQNATMIIFLKHMSGFAGSNGGKYQVQYIMDFVHIQVLRTVYCASKVAFSTDKIPPSLRGMCPSIYFHVIFLGT